ncbi:LuxR C-terminal-related transcriptional regulator [Streptomyces sp. ADMS]|uniref:helix-turn-helix transcriptional regulator n=1 Tax=Streptomyces sp. ADMS TaxID=3071415 RepID=UPI00296F775E|nr:LuxR C-terminal-related transcriptional regulator [Streptomyces sp. ADMS]MDW4910651.1 LuxR C-terminal-related transcriptional regulator [Streptomyces sp. ADMS]
MKPSHTRVLAEAAYAAGARDRHEAAMTVLRLLEPVTHHDAGALLLWDPAARAHRVLAAVTYGDETVAALGDRYAASAENRPVRERHLPMRIDDMPGDYRLSPMYREVLGPAGFQDGMTACLSSGGGVYTGMLHFSAAARGAFRDDAAELLEALAPALAQMCDVARRQTTRCAIPAEANATLIDHTGRAWAVESCAPARAPTQPGFTGFLHRFMASPQVAATGLRASSEGWLALQVLKVADPLGRPEPAVLVQELPTASLPHSLSPREYDILNGMAAGFSNQQLASQRDVALRTVTTHVERILHKMGQPSRAGAVASALREGILYLDR